MLTFLVIFSLAALSVLAYILNDLRRMKRRSAELDALFDGTIGQRTIDREAKDV